MSETTITPGDLFRAGKLPEALAAATAAVKKSPADLGARILLAELLTFSGNFERADVILDAATNIDTSALTVVAEFRQLLRGETARRQLFRDGRVPEFLGEPGATEQASLAALVALRAGDLAEAAAKAAEAEEVRPRVAGEMGKQKFDDFRDADDLLPGLIETITSTGKYYWIPVSRIETMMFHPPKRPRDLIWRRCSMAVTAGPDGDVYIPVTYVSEPEHTTDAQRLGRETSWSEEGAGPVRGFGQRIFMVGEDAVGIMDISSLEFGV